MLNMYQLWLDDLYPRAKFADGLTIIEKLGHTKRVQLMRKEWINEGKPRHTAGDEDEDAISVAEEITHADEAGMEGIEQEQTSQNRIEADLQKASLNEKEPAQALAEDPDEDELDALLAESTITPQVQPRKEAVDTEDDPFADAMEAMADMDDMW